MQVIVKELDKTRAHFEAAMYRVGEKTAKRAFARALNREGGKIRTKVRRALRPQTGIKAGKINANVVTARRATWGSLVYVIEGRGKELPLIEFGARQFRYGVRARPWNQARRFKSAFIVSSLGNAFVRSGASRFPIEGMYGPSIAKEIVKDNAEAAFEQSQPAVLAEATRQIAKVLP